MEAYKHGVSVLQRLKDQAPPEMMEAWANRMEKALEPAVNEVRDVDSEFLSRLTQGKTFSPEEKVRVELTALAQSFELRRSLLEGALSAPETARLLGVSRQTPHDRAKANTLLGIPDGGAWKFPAWQFDAESPDGVIPGLPAVLKALGSYVPVSALQKAAWLTRRNAALGGRTPLQALRDGEVENVVEEAQGLLVH
jgi:hypothetical protein